LVFQFIKLISKKFDYFQHAGLSVDYIAPARLLYAAMVLHAATRRLPAAICEEKVVTDMSRMRGFALNKNKRAIRPRPSIYGQDFHRVQKLRRIPADFCSGEKRGVRDPISGSQRNVGASSGHRRRGVSIEISRPTSSADWGYFPG
jgi:hypothetical protein